MVKHTQAICRQQSTNCLSVFDHFVELALKGLKLFGSIKQIFSSVFEFLSSKTRLFIRLCKGFLH